MNRVKCITFDKEAQDALPEHIKNKMKADRIAARAINFCERIAKMEKGCAPSAGYMQELIEAAEIALN
jgi:copper homeostasis protein CutC